ncbi:hypothetical protein K2173_018792 [Erythroxylum novogranatense]|uniref:lipid-A-disaccharide synthase n=1 Tax=Erythroxylum novogranatense TaxID=1862640 RepID=A0AAV8SB86_9ROSI|nr:hypothetical protein K2173_018792 [Erythroxylum novogranatense]
MAGVLPRIVRNLKDEVVLRLPILPSRYLSVGSRPLVDKAVEDGELRVFVVAGEVSGDTIGSRLMASLKKLCPVPVRFSGVGGSMMAKEGLESLFPIEDIAVMGIWELLPHLNNFRVKLKKSIEDVLCFQPHVVVTVDSKGFSFRLLKQLRGNVNRPLSITISACISLMHKSTGRKCGEMVFAARCNQQGKNYPVHYHYVAPSFWAWKGGEARLRGLANFVDHIFCILPNEDTVCKSNGVDATFVGHPILEDVLELNSGKQPHGWRIQKDCAYFRSKYAVPSDATVISLLPGSRLQEVSRMLSIFTKTIELIKESFPKLLTVIHVAPNQHVENYINEVTQKWPGPIVLIPGGNLHLKYCAFSASKVALCTSGTVAMELLLGRLPCVVAYRAHLLTEWIIKYKAKIPYMSLPNILMDSAIIPEALFQGCTATNLSSMLMELMNNKALQEEQIVSAEKVMRLLTPSKQVMNYLEEQDGKWNSATFTPSMIAASTMLCYVKN